MRERVRHEEIELSRKRGEKAKAGEKKKIDVAKGRDRLSEQE